MMVKKERQCLLVVTGSRSKVWGLLDAIRYLRYYKSMRWRRLNPHALQSYLNCDLCTLLYDEYTMVQDTHPFWRTLKDLKGKSEPSQIDGLSRAATDSYAVDRQ